MFNEESYEGDWKRALLVADFVTSQLALREENFGSYNTGGEF